MKLKVFLNMYGIRQEMGLLLQDKKRIFFEYAPDFLYLPTVKQLTA